MWLNLRSEFSFGAAYGHIDKLAKAAVGYGFAGIADDSSTWGHIKWRKYCQKLEIKPIYGVRLPVAYSLQRDERRYPFNNMTFIAITTKGLQEIYGLVDKAHKQFYYRPRLDYDQINQTNPNDIAILSGVGPNFDLIHRDIFLELTPATPLALRGIKSIPPMAGCDNYYPNVEDRGIYEPFADFRKVETKTTPQHIISHEEWMAIYPGREAGLDNLMKLGEICNPQLTNAPMVKYYKDADIHKICIAGAKRKKINLKDPIYKARYEREMKLIKEKDYVDYFLMVADVVKYAKSRMAVGPARGSSAGSLVCYLMDITEVDPIPFDLYFERFIDINRFDLPDIDIDFQDDKRDLVIKYLQRKYGKNNVAQIGNVNRLKPKSAISRFAKSLNVPIDDVVEVKDAILERSGGDARASLCMEDTFNDTEAGKRFIENYPDMLAVSKVEAHASHSGVHAAGILVCNHPLTKYCGINSRDNKRIGMLDKKDAEEINLLKIDALGLRTLTILADACDQIGKKFEWMYHLPLDDPEAFQVIRDGRLTGIFQFEGPAIQSLNKQMAVDKIDDIFALSALGRPGPLATGGASTFIDARMGLMETKYLNNNPIVKKLTEGTFGVVIYQEQMLAIGREYGGLSWKDVGELRKAASKSLGDEFFGKYKDKFIAGAMKSGETENDAKKAWDGISTSGSWTFNKSHAVSYGMITYFCAYMKAHYPLEFAVAGLNHSKDDPSALKSLRDLKENEGIDYVAVDPEISKENWSVYKGKLYGGLTTVHGIGPANAKKIIKARKKGEKLPPGLANKLQEPIKTPFKYLYPAKELYGDYYTNPKQHEITRPVSRIEQLNKNKGEYVILGQLIKKGIRDLNETVFVTKRGGTFAEGDTTWLNLTLEDDTGMILCTVGRDKYNYMGKPIAETGKENKDWYLVYGTLNKKRDFKTIYIKNIRRITRE